MKIKNISRNTIATLFLGLYMVNGHSADSRIRTQGEFFYYAQLEQFRTIVKYCGQKVPSHRKVLYGIYEKFLDRFDNAIRPIAEQVGDEWHAPISAAEVDQGMAMVRQSARQVIPKIEQAGADRFCPNFALTLTDMTSASLIEVFQSSYEQYWTAKTGSASP